MSVQELNTAGLKVQASPVLGGGRAWLVWLLATTFVVWLFNVQTGYAILNSKVAGEIGLGMEQVGMIAAVYTWVFAIAQMFSGALLDKLGARKVLIPAIALVGIGVWLFAYAESFEMLLLSQVVLALGSCAGFVGAGYIGGVWFGMAKFGVMFGLVQVVAALSSAFGQAGFDVALSVMSWRELMIGFGVFGVGLLVLAFLFVRNPVETDTRGLTASAFVCSVLSSIGEVLKNRQVMLIALAGAISFGVMLALGVVWAPKLVMAHGVEESSANLASAALWLGMAVGSLFINQWTDKVKSRKQPVIITLLVQLLALAGLIYLPLTSTMAQALCFVFGAANAGHMLAFTMAGDNVPVRLIGTAASVVNGSMFIIGGVLMGLPGSMLEGTAGDLAAFQHAMLVMLGLLVISLFVTFVTRECYPKQGH